MFCCLRNMSDTAQTSVENKLTLDACKLIYSTITTQNDASYILQLVLASEKINESATPLPSTAVLYFQAVKCKGKYMLRRKIITVK